MGQRPGPRAVLDTEGMLRELRIENLLLIEKAELRLGEGLNAITGETGAGKTVLAHSLDLLMGGKARPQIVRPGRRGGLGRGGLRPARGAARRARVGGDRRAAAGWCRRGRARPAGLGRGADQRLRRRTRRYGGRPEAAWVGRLLAFYGQHEHRKLTIASAQLDVLDGFAGAEHLALRESYREAHRECLRLAAELAELRERDGSRERDLDLYRYELSEIEAVAPDPAEAAELAGERERLRHAEGLREAAAGAHSAALGAEEDGGGARGALAQAEALLQGAAGVDSVARRALGPPQRPGDRARRRRRRAARLPGGPRGRSRSARRGRGAARGARPAASASTAAASSRCSPTPSAAGRRSSAWRTPASAAPRPRRRWPRPRRAAPSSPPS